MKDGKLMTLPELILRIKAENSMQMQKWGVQDHDGFTELEQGAAA